MGKKVFLASLTVFLLGFGPLPAAAQSHYKVLHGPKDFYFGHISLVDIRNDGLDPVVLRSGAEAPEPASLNLPIGPGDIIRTSSERRVEIQFDNASIVRLDKNSELLIETILAPSLSEPTELSNLSLRKGLMFIAYRQFNSRELFQVLTPTAAVKLQNESVASIGLTETGETEVRIKYGKGTLLYGTDPKAFKELSVAANEQAVVGRNERPAVRPDRDDTDFEVWNKAVNSDFIELHQGKTSLPRPLHKMPWEIIDFARKFGNHYGEWIEDKKFGFVWRPYDNDVRPEGSWAPYFARRWSNYGGLMYWVSSEPWGWIPYHLGLWQRDEKNGWFWIPGSAFAPAWVSWSFFGGTFWVWKPWSMHDWGFHMNRFWYEEWYGGAPNYWAWRFRNLAYWQGPGYLAYISTPTGSAAPQSVSRAQTRTQDRLESPLPMPPEFKAGFKKLMDALQRRESWAIQSLLAQTRSEFAVDRDHLNSADLRARAVPFQAILDLSRALPASDSAKPAPSAISPPPSDSAAGASRAFQINAKRAASAAAESRPLSENLTRIQARSLPFSVRSMEAPPASRCLDWNPDIRLAQKLGVEIRYSSLTNEVVCPQLNISSSRPGGLGGGPSFPAFSKAATELNAGQNSSNSANTATTSQKVSSASTSSSGSNTESSSSRIKN